MGGIDVTDNETVVVGLDGAHFELLYPWIEAGELPNVEQLCRSGTAADLTSVLPPVTSPNWKAYTTGKNPGKLGIYWWENVDVTEGRIYYPHRRKQAHTEFWESFPEWCDVGVIGVPTTYPPKSVGSFYVSGAPDGNEDGYAYPAHLEAELEDRFGYRVTKQTRLKDDVDVAAREIVDLIDTRFTAAKYLFDRYDVDFLQVTTFYINALHHYLWDHEYTLAAWKVIDDHLEAFREDDRNVILMSDHGSTPTETVFYVNTWLRDVGYLTVDARTPRTLHRLGITKDRCRRLGRLLGGRNPLAYLPQSVRTVVPAADGTLSRDQKASVVDWQQSDVVASAQGPVYVSPPGESAGHEVTDDIAAGIRDLRDPQGRPVVEAVHRAEDIYAGPYMADAPALVLEQRPGVDIAGDVGKGQTFVDPATEGWRAENKRRGLFVASGPSFGDDTLSPLSILDLAPTLLHLYGVEIPSDMDGTVRKDVFAPGSDAAERDVTWSRQDPRARERARIRRVARSLRDSRDL